MADCLHGARLVRRTFALLACSGALLPGCLDRMESAADLDRRIAAHQTLDGQVGPGADTGVLDDSGSVEDTGSGTDLDAYGGSDFAVTELGPETTDPDTDTIGPFDDSDGGGSEGVGPDMSGPSCMSSGDCTDGDSCTVDTCNEGTCVFLPVACGPGTACAGGFCVGTAICGDGLVGAGEQCDDSNKKNGDGCSATCQVEPPPGMVFIAAGQFSMGCASGDNDCQQEETPAHTVALYAYNIDKQLVTASQYAACVTGGQGCSTPSGSASSKQATYGVAGKSGYPVNYVTWTQAKTFCEAKGHRLCTEAEWEHAARGPGNTIYPWGNAKPACSQASFASCNPGVISSGALPQGISKFGVLDMAGNVWQWVADGYLYYSVGTIADPQGDDTSPFRVLRGGSFESPAAGVRSTARYELGKTESGYDIGFRCCHGYTTP